MVCKRGLAARPALGGVPAPRDHWIARDGLIVQRSGENAPQCSDDVFHRLGAAHYGWIGFRLALGVGVSARDVATALVRGQQLRPKVGHVGCGDTGHRAVTEHRRDVGSVHLGVAVDRLVVHCAHKAVEVLLGVLP